MVINSFQKSFNFLSVASRFLLRSKRNSARLSEVGVLENPVTEGVYATGQLLLHRVFGYRGVVLFPWNVRVYDRDEKVKVGDDSPSHSDKASHADVETITESTTAKRPTAALNTDVYYQVLIDSRDIPYTCIQTESVTFLGAQGKGLYSIPGLDYVSHADVLPYSSNEKSPIIHELFDRFLSYDVNRRPPYVGRSDLLSFQKTNHSWLLISDIHRETTEDIRVTVIPFYMGFREEGPALKYWWRYIIRLENLGDLAVQLRERHWKILSHNGTLDTIKGRGVIGWEPVLSEGQPAFQYSSQVSLESPSGHMWGSFKIEREDGYTFDCKIPSFALESKVNAFTGLEPNGSNPPTPTPPTPQPDPFPDGGGARDN